MRSRERSEFRQFNVDMGSIATASGGFIFVDPFEFLCKDGSCANLDDAGFPLYSDRGHLSVWGSDLLVGHLSGLLVEQADAVRAKRQLVQPTRIPIDPQSVALHGDGLYTARLGSPAPRTQAYQPIQLTEDGEYLRPADATDDEIRRGTGGWRYLPSGELRFCSSDGSDPRTNGRSYALVLWNPSGNVDEPRVGR